MHYTATVRGIEINSVLRNTYLLLSLTLGVTALTAYYSTFLTFGIGVYIAALVGVLVLLFAVFLTRSSAWSLLFVFMFTGLFGFAMGPTIKHYLALESGPAIIAQAVGTTAVIFMSLSAYVLVTRKNFNFLGGMLFMSLIGLLVVSIIGSFFNAPMLHTAISFVGVLIFSGYILYDTSEIIHGGQTNYVLATVGLYLDIVNLFLDLLRIFSFFSGDD